MKSMRRRVVAMLLTLSMLITMFPASMLANGTSTDGTQTWQISKSKTATELDANYQSKVTLSLPAAQEQLESDVVFVLDKSTSTRTDISKMLKELSDQISISGGKVKVGVVIFNKQANIALELTELNSENMDTINNALNQEYTSGTNIHAGLLAGKKMLDKDASVDANRKYMILVSDGISYMYNEVPTSILTIGYEVGAQPVIPSFTCTLDAWDNKYGYGQSLKDITEKQNSVEAVQTFLYGEDGNGGIAEKVKVDAGAYDKSYDELKAFCDAPEGIKAVTWKALKSNNRTAPVAQETYDNLYGDDQNRHANNVEKAMYLVAETFKAAQDAGYNCYAIDSAATPNSLYPWGSELMDYLAKDKGDVDFTQIKEEIYYLVDVGSTVKDYMGYDASEDGYNFDLVINDDRSNPYMTIDTLDADGKSIKTEKLEAISKGSNQYGFDRNDDGVYEYELEYSSADNGNEHFTWKTNVRLTNFERVQLHYTVKLTNPQTTPGEYKDLYTNNSATLTAKDTNGGTYTEDFAKPTVSYTVAEKDPVTITPADITVYTGGTEYAGVVDGTGEIIDPLENGGLPTPGYLITLPKDINDDIFGGIGNAEDLTGRVRFVYDGDEDEEYDSLDDRIWDLNLYSDGANMTSSTSQEDGIARYVYRMDQDSLNKIPVRMQFKDGDIIKTSDDFTIDASKLYQVFEMSIYPGGLSTGKIKAQILDANKTTVLATRDVNVGTAQLTIRGTTNSEEFSGVVHEESAVSTNKNNITALVPDDAKYMINQSQVSVTPEDVSLLSDAVVDTSILKDYIVDQNIADNDENFEYRYLDLVDRTNGNAYVTADKPIDVYWKLPEGASSDDNFRIVHFKGLDRQYNGSTEDLIGTTGHEVEEYSVANKNLSIVTINDVEYLKFSVDSFSPFVLAWSENEDDSNTPSVTPSVPNGDDTPDLNTEDHFSYVVGYPEDYRTGEPSDNEELWPVKPQGNITRAEVASIFYRLLKDDVRDANTTDVSEFSDVSASDWYGTTVATLSAMDIVRGYEDGTFRPNAPITRAEFAAIATRFFEETGAEYEPGTFDDVTGDEWFANAIADAVELGLIGGYPDGTVRPNNNITRAEACAIVNRTLGRIPHVDHLLPADDMKTWPDNNPSDWFYADMQEATNGHEYEWTTEQGQKVEEWTEILDKDWEDR